MARNRMFLGRWVFGGGSLGISVLLTSGAMLQAQTVADRVGFTDLMNRYGVTLPDGSGVSLLVTEVCDDGVELDIESSAGCSDGWVDVGQ